MTGLLRASTLVRQPVVTLDGESLLEVKDVVFDRASGEILGFALRKKGSLGGLVPDRLPWPAVHGLGPDAVMISDESVLTSEGGGDLEGGGDVIGDRVLTESGTDLGEVVEVVIATGGQADVVGFEIEPVAAAAGDVRAVTFLLEQLPAELADISQELDGQSPDLIADQTVRAAADIVARDTVSVLEQYNEAAGQGRAATDAAETLAALSEGRVETLLVHDDPNDDRTARFERPGLACSIPDPSATDPVPADAATGRLVDVAIRSALLSDAAIRFVSAHAGSPDGLGATLRW